MANVREMLFNKRVGFFGFGKSNSSLMKALPLENSEIVLRSEQRIDRRSLPSDLKNFRIMENERAFDRPWEDVIFVSPSVRRDRCEFKKMESEGVRLSSDAELFFGNNSSPLYAVTGSDGKSTTTTLTAKLLKKNHNVGLVGNIGNPMFSSLSDKKDIYVAELSSFMLSYSTPISKRAAITNITPNHLDWHKSFDEYKSAKLSILKNAEEKILSFDDEILREYAKSNEVFGVTSSTVGYSELKKQISAEIYITLEEEKILLNGKALVNVNEIRRNEIYNLKNLMMSAALAYGEFQPSDIREIAAEFGGLPNRCELVFSSDSVDFYNSSIDSTPSRTVATLNALNRRAVVVLGGRGKGTSFSELRPALERYAECAVICGECADKIYRDVKGTCRIILVDNFDDAVDFASELGRSCGCVLLSPAATSYDEFKNYDERGKRFCELIKKHN